MNVSLDLSSLTAPEIAQIQRQTGFPIENNKLTVPYFTALAPISPVWTQVVDSNDLWWEFWKDLLYIKGPISSKTGGYELRFGGDLLYWSDGLANPHFVCSPTTKYYLPSRLTHGATSAQLIAADASLIIAARWAVIPAPAKIHYCHFVADFVCEILSPGQTVGGGGPGDLDEKCVKWIRMGVELVWLLDPIGRQTAQYCRRPTGGNAPLVVGAVTYKYANHINAPGPTGDYANYNGIPKPTPATYPAVGYPGVSRLVTAWGGAQGAGAAGNVAGVGPIGGFVFNLNRLDFL